MRFLSRFLVSALFFTVLAATQAAERGLQLVAPTDVPAGGSASVLISASTNFDGERVAFVHVEYSIDAGKTWQVLFYETDLGETFSRRADFSVAPTKGKAILRARAAFRSAAGDVDYVGTPIQWDTTWAQWRTPPTRYAIIYVGGR